MIDPSFSRSSPCLCVLQLLEKTEEEDLVCLCKLMSTIGGKLEAYDAKKKKGYMKEYFATIQALAESHESSRMR